MIVAVEILKILIFIYIIYKCIYAFNISILYSRYLNCILCTVGTCIYDKYIYTSHYVTTTVFIYDMAV